MKFMLLVLILPFVLSFSQTPNYPDSITINSGKTYPCFVKNMDESSVDIIYLNNVPGKGQFQSVKDITLEKLGRVYQKGSGLLLPLDTIQAFLSSRNASAMEEVTAKSDLPSGNLSSEDNKRWSFGILYVPYYSLVTYYVSQNYPIQLYSYVYNSTNTEGELSYLLMEKLRLTLNVRYTSINSDDRQENHVRDASSSYKSDYGQDASRKISVFNLDLGIKYYIANILNQRTSAYVLAGIGKQFASSKYNTESLFVTTPPATTTEDNSDEFVSDINSPFHFQAGFGAEYSFNDFLSVNSNIRFYYSSVSAKFDSRVTGTTSSTVQTRDYKNSDINTYVGLGLNFYF